MAHKQKWYNAKEARNLLEYVGKNYPQLRKTDAKMYRALEELERKQDGLCKDIVANHRTLAHTAKINVKTAGATLLRLQAMRLVVYKVGSTDYSEHIASRIRRYSLQDLKKETEKNQPAHRLAAILNKRPITYGSKIVQPTYTVRTTNRLYSRQPNVQGSKSVRAERLAAGCKYGEILFELDFSAAEPSVISGKLGYKKDGYRLIAEAEGTDRNTVKKFFNAIVYARTTAVQAGKLNDIRSADALKFLKAVDALRTSLRYPDKKPVRYVVTETGRRIDAPSGHKLHKGTLLSYYAQGTIADFINEAALSIIEQEQECGWRLISPCHDALYVIAKPEQANALRQIVLAEPLKAGLTMQLKVNRTQSKNETQQEKKNAESP